MERLDDLLYPYYLEYAENRSGFYDKHHTEISELFSKISNGGKFWFKYCTAKNGDKCFSVSVIYNDKLILNRVGYKTQDIALMSIIDSLRNFDFVNIN